MSMLREKITTKETKLNKWLTMEVDNERRKCNAKERSAVILNSTINSIKKHIPFLFFLHSFWDLDDYK